VSEMAEDVERVAHAIFLAMGPNSAGSLEVIHFQEQLVSALHDAILIPLEEKAQAYLETAMAAGALTDGNILARCLAGEEVERVPTSPVARAGQKGCDCTVGMGGLADGCVVQ